MSILVKASNLLVAIWLQTKFFCNYCNGHFNKELPLHRLVNIFFVQHTTQDSGKFLRIMLKKIRVVKIAMEAFSKSRVAVQILRPLIQFFF